MNNTSTENDERYENDDYNSDNSIESVDEEFSDEEIDGDDTDGGLAKWMTRLSAHAFMGTTLSNVPCMISITACRYCIMRWCFNSITYFLLLPVGFNLFTPC